MTLRCERCRGQLFTEDDEVFCLQCGHRRPVVPLEPLDKPKNGAVTKYDMVKHGTG